MSDKVWLGSIFIKNEGGFDIIMRAMNHYNRRLHRISASPEIADAGAMFGSVLESQSAKIMPQLKIIADRLRAGLCDESVLAEVRDDIEIIEKALICYKSDITKHNNGVHQYYTDLLKGNNHADTDVDLIDTCIQRLKDYDSFG